MENIEVGDYIEVTEDGGNNSAHPKYKGEYFLKKGDKGTITLIENEWGHDKQQYKDGRLVFK